MGTVYRAGTLLAKFHFRTFAHWTVEGKEGVPPWGPLIIVSNHLSNADPCFIVASIPRTLHFLAKRSLFSNSLASAFLRAANVHPVSRAEADLAAIRTCLQLLGRDQPVLFFPEGTRSRGEGMKRAKSGVAYIASRSQAPILPVAITGTEAISGYWRIPFPLCRVRVRIGQPFSLPVVEGKLSRPVLESMTDTIMQRVAVLLPEEYQGHYALQESSVRG